MHQIHRNTVHRILKEYDKSETPWIVGFSGGKDSSAVIKFVTQAVSKSKHKNRRIYIVFCDTGVENPLVTEFVKFAFRKINTYAKREFLPISTHLLKPKTKDSYWVKVIGRGCPPPTNRFRWCTDKLRVNPLRNFSIKKKLNNPTTVLGLRKGESNQRDLAIKKYVINKFYLSYYDSKDRLFYCPIFNYKVADVWSYLSNSSIFGNEFFTKLSQIYGVDDQCNNISRSSSLRMGCWICTVIRKDKSAEDLISRGYTQLEPYLRFRDWITIFRENPIYRRKRRRNGSKGPGPITMKGRRIILSKLLKLQKEVNTKIVTDSDLSLIYLEWKRDRQ